MASKKKLVHEKAMKSLELCLLSLLENDRVLTIARTEDGFMIAHADVEVEDADIVFVPSTILTSSGSLVDAIAAFDSHQLMNDVKGYQA